MRDYFELQAVPSDENCAQLGAPGYSAQAKKECQALIAQLKRQFGDPPGTARLIVRANNHDFGVYYEVAVTFDTDDAIATDYALKLDAKFPSNWDDQARRELGLEASTA